MGLGPGFVLHHEWRQSLEMKISVIFWRLLALMVAKGKS